ncbi:mucin-12 [Clarias gariepinus]|uniref:mucin-4 n=1 Tax=Clarias gariepinus TaxID=13013 RepID=UPI00234C47EA|nr:mucin-4 [Clarias gariepinus]
MKNYSRDFDNLNSEASKNLTSVLSRELSDICRRADSQNFRGVNITRLANGSIIVNSVAVYTYPNNQSQIDFLNKDLEPSLIKLFNDSNSLKHLGEALGNVSVQDIEVLVQTAEITNVTELQQYINCSWDFANYTPTLDIVEGSWVCEGQCKSNSSYCNAHGDCVNLKTGPECQCHKSSFEIYSGQHCEIFNRGAGFYAALFGSLGAALLLIIIVIIVVVVIKLKKRKCWTISSSSESRRSDLFEDYFFDFTERGQLQKYTLHENTDEYVTS